MRVPGRALLCAMLALSVCGVSLAADDVSVRVNVGRRSMLLPAGYTATGERLEARNSSVGVKDVERVLTSITTPAGRRLVLLLQAVDAAGLFQWDFKCSRLKSDELQFVYSPVHSMRDECVVVVGPVELAGVLQEVVPELKASQALLDEAAVGYLVRAQYAAQTGSMLSALVFVPEPFSGAVPGGKRPANDSGLPDEVVAWALNLGREVQAGVRSFSGDWQLPPINEKE
ncbi:hypothetical protein SAMN02787076_02199 [Rhizobacter sp. OV335]|nr:hypothetical protein SAMN02787076_02199 [Rhizobacter sp. OV335]